MAGIHFHYVYFLWDLDRLLCVLLCLHEMFLYLLFLYYMHMYDAIGSCRCRVKTCTQESHSPSMPRTKPELMSFTVITFTGSMLIPYTE